MQDSVENLPQLGIDDLAYLNKNPEPELTALQVVQNLYALVNEQQIAINIFGQPSVGADMA